MKSYFNLLLIGATAMFAACNNEDAPEAKGGEGNEIAFLCSYAPESRATDTAFEGNDRIGVYIVADGKTLQTGGNELNNEQFSYNGTAWTPARKAYWNEGVHNVYAYYPYVAKVNDTEDFTFDLQTDQSTHAGYTASDFLWASKTGVTASASPVSLQFAHRMSKAIIKLEKERTTRESYRLTARYIYTAR